MKTCTGCGETKPLDAFNRTTRTPDHHDKLLARKKLKRAVQSGKLTRPERCEACGRPGRIDGHHDDYARPLDVRWLCTTCHRSAHMTEAA